MSHQTNNNLKIENISDFSIIDAKKSPIFGISKARQGLLNNNTDNIFVGNFNPKNFEFSRIFSVCLDEVGEHIDYTLKSSNTSYFKDLSNKKLSQIMENDVLNKKAKKVTKCFKKELTKINKVNNQKKQNKNKLIKPVLFEEEKQTINNNIEKPKIFEKTIFPTMNNFKQISLPSNNFLNLDFQKNFNIFNGNNNLPFPNVLFPNKMLNNNFLNIPLNTKINKIKSLEEKPSNTFNILKYPKPINPIIEEKLISPPLISKEEPIKEQSLNLVNQFSVKSINTRKGRKSKNCKDDNIESKHTKFSEDNMMRKIKNKIIESSRLLANKLFIEELKDVKEKHYFNCKEFRKIKGSFSQELNIKFNLYFYFMTIKDIFSLELSHKYTALENHSNKELIDYIFSDESKDNFNKTKSILDMPFHKYYHNIFLNEEKNWKETYGIEKEDNTYQIDSVLKSLEEKPDENEKNNEKYSQKINYLAHHYEDFFLGKKTRNVELGNKKEECIKSILETTLPEQYEYYMNQLKIFKDLYEKQSGPFKEPKIKSPFILTHFNNYKKDNLLINEKSNNSVFDIETIKEGNENEFLAKKIINNENENKLNDNEINILSNNENKNEFCGKKRKFSCKRIDSNESETKAGI
jgi:hypothetical protein